MQEMGLEPTLCCHNRHLKPARLPFRHSCEQMLFYRKNGRLSMMDFD